MEIVSRHHIGGTLDYAALATLHRPSDPAMLAREARHLLALGLTYADVAACIGISKAAVKQLLKSTTEKFHDCSHFP